MSLTNCSSSTLFENKSRKNRKRYCIKYGGSCLDTECSCCRCNGVVLYDDDDKARKCILQNTSTAASTLIPTSLIMKINSNSTSTVMAKSTTTQIMQTTGGTKTLEFISTTAVPKGIDENPDKTNHLPIILGVVVAFCVLLGAFIFVIIWKRRKTKKKNGTESRNNLHLQLAAIGDHSTYEQVTKFDVESPAYAYVAADAKHAPQSCSKAEASSPPYSYVDSDRISKMLVNRSKEHLNEETSPEQNGVQSPVYFTLEENNPEYASAGLLTDDPLNGPQTSNGDPYYLALKGEEPGRYTELEPGGYSKTETKTESDNYKELLHSPESDIYQELIKDDVAI